MNDTPAPDEIESMAERGTGLFGVPPFELAVKALDAEPFFRAPNGSIRDVHSCDARARPRHQLGVEAGAGSNLQHIVVGDPVVRDEAIERSLFGGVMVWGSL